MWVYIAAWAVLLVVFVVVEAATETLTSIWFAGGALAALIVSLLGGGIVWQCVVFILITAVLLVLTRPLAKKILNRKKVATNTDSLVGQNGIVLLEVDNLQRTGRVRVNNLDWSAQSGNGEVIPVGTVITVLEIRGVTLVVEQSSAT